MSFEYCGTTTSAASSDASMPPVKGLRVDTVDLTHQTREVGAPRVNNKMVMVIHQAISERDGVKALHRLGGDIQKTLTVCIVFEYVFAPVSTRSHVIDCAGEFYA